MHLPRTLALIVGTASLPLLAHCSSSSTTTPSATGDGGVTPASTCVAPTGAGTKHSGDTITADTTWKAADGPHRLTSGIIVDTGATLTIEPCAQIVVETGGIEVRGSLVAEGGETTPITFDAADPASPWSGISLASGSSAHVSLAYATLSNGGNADNPNILGLIDARGPSDVAPVELLKLKNVTLKTSQQNGLVLRGSAALTADSANLTVSGAKLFPVRASTRLASNIPTGTYTGNTNDEILFDLSVSYVVNDVTIHDRGVPYRLGGLASDNAGNHMTIGDSHTPPRPATVTIEAGVTLRASAGTVIDAAKVDDNTPVGHLIVAGTADKPVVFTSAAATPKAGDWQGILFATSDGKDKIDHARVEFAGGPSQSNSAHCDPGGTFSKSEDAAIAIYGKPPTTEFITNTTIVSSAGAGISLSYMGANVDFMATNTFQSVTSCKVTFPRAMDGSCPATVPCP